MASNLKESLVGIDTTGVFRNIVVGFIGLCVLLLVASVAFPAWAMGMLDGQMLWSFVTDIRVLLWEGWWQPALIVAVLILLIWRATTPTKSEDQ